MQRLQSLILALSGQMQFRNERVLRLYFIETIELCKHEQKSENKHIKSASLVCEISTEGGIFHENEKVCTVMILSFRTDMSGQTGAV